MSRVSVIVPCFNYGRYLPDCVRSVLTQEGVEVSVLVIDDASDDDTADVATRIARADPRVQVRRHPVNLGHIATYNEGLEWADGDYTVLLSADDLLTPGALLRASTLMDSHEQVGFVYGRGIPLPDGLPTSDERLGRTTSRVLTGANWLAERCMKGNFAVVSATVMVRTRVQREVGGYRSWLPHRGDTEMWIRFSLRSAVGVLEAKQAWYRLHAGNMSNDFAPRAADLAQLKVAVESILEHDRRWIGDSTAWMTMTHRGVARFALAQLRAELDAGHAITSTSAREIVSFIGDLDPGADPVSGSRGLRWRVRAGPRICRIARHARNVLILARHPERIRRRQHLRRAAALSP